MSWAALAPALAAELATIADLGQFYLGERHFRDSERSMALLLSPVSDEQKRLRAWFLTRDSIAEDWWTQDRTRSTQRYTLRGYFGVTGRLGSESEFQAKVDDVQARLRTLKSLADADLVTYQAIVLGHARIGPQETALLCHYAELSLEVEETHTITLTSPTPSITAEGVASRDGYEAVAAQLAAYVAAVEPDWHVYTERPAGKTQEDLDAQFRHPVPGEEERRTVRAWRVYRTADEEELGVSSIVTARPAWRLACSMGWHDASSSYDRFQTYLDSVRAMVRGRADLGRPTKRSCALSTPLQVPEIGARMLMGSLVHYADCQLGVEELVYA